MDNTNKIEFIGNLRPIQSAILLDGIGDGARIRIDISRQYVQEIVKLQSFAGLKIQHFREYRFTPYKRIK